MVIPLKRCEGQAEAFHTPEKRDSNEPPARRRQSAIRQHFSAVDIRENETARGRMGFRTAQRAKPKLMSFSVFAYQFGGPTPFCAKPYRSGN
jgi:hypothetical protein